MNTIFNIILPLPEGKISIRIKKPFFNLALVRYLEKGNVQQKRWGGGGGNREGKTKKQNNNNNNEKLICIKYDKTVS